MSAPSTFAADLPPKEEKHQHQKHETSEEIESIPLFFISYSTAESLIWWFELFMKFFALLSTSITLIPFWILMENSNVLISDGPWIGLFLLLQWILWIPAIVFVWYSLGTNNWEFLWRYLSYYRVFEIINFVTAAISVFLFFYPSIKEAISISKIVAENFQFMSIFYPYMIMNCCWFCFEVVKFLREKTEA